MKNIGKRLLSLMMILILLFSNMLSMNTIVYAIDETESEIQALDEENDEDILQLESELEKLEETEEVDKSQLATEIEEAKTNKESVVVSVDGRDVDKDQYWVTEEVMTTYEAIILSSEEIYEKEDATQEEVDNQVIILQSATEEFNSNKQLGTKEEITYEFIEGVLNKNLEYIITTVDNPTFASIGGEWSIIGLARGEYEVYDGYYDTYYNNVVSQVEELMEKYDGKLDKNKGAEHSRLILGLTAIGKDITDVAGYDIREALADFSFVTKQGINGPVFALIAFDSHDYDIPVIEGIEEQTTREKLINYILEKEIDGGGWALWGDTPDVDITATTIQALAPYYESNEDVKEAVDRAIEWLSRVQAEDGSYLSWGTTNSESCAQVIVALTSLGIDPHNDERFIKNGNSVVEALLSFAVEDGGFYHVKPGDTGNGGANPGEVDLMATEQGTYALVAYDRFVKGKTSLYDMTDVELESEKEPEITEIQVPDGEEDYTIDINDQNIDNKIIITIPENKVGKVIANIPVESELPEISANKGNISVIFPEGIVIKTEDDTLTSIDVELITSKDIEDTSLEEILDKIIDDDEELDNISEYFALGSTQRIEFTDFITITISGMANKDAAYIEDGEAHIIEIYQNDLEGLNSGKEEYAFNNKDDLIIKTKHFTDFIIYTTKEIEEDNDNDTPYNPSPEVPEKMHVTLSIDKFTIGKGYVIEPTEVEFTEGETVWDVTKREMDKRGIEYTYSWYDIYNSVYVEWIDGDGEFDHGSGSGWMYNVNGWYPNYGASLYELEDGDVVQWRYTTNLGADLGEDLSQWEDSEDEDNEDEDKKEENNNEESSKSESNNENYKNNSEENVEKDSSNESSTSLKDSKKQVDLKEIYTDWMLISSWAYDSVEKATEKGFIEGDSGKFEPKRNITRAEFTKIIVLVLGLDTEIDKVIDFSDVNEDDWFYPYVNAAYKAGIVEGHNGRFNPYDNITREQMAVMVIRGLGVSYTKSEIIFNDMDKVSKWAKMDVETAKALNVMEGSNNYFKPKDYTTREMAVTVAMRAYDYIAENSQKDNKYEEAIDVTKYIENTAEFLQNTVTNPVVASIGGEWTVLGLARSYVNVPDEYFNNYYLNVENTLKEKSGVLHRIKYTEYDRVILALTSIGKDITNVAGYDLRKPLADFETVIKQGINGPIFALIALDSNNYEIPVDEDVNIQTTRELLIDFILSREIEGGGWALGKDPTVPDPDITAMAIQALAPYYESNEDVKEAVDRAIMWLSKVQKENGSYESWGSDNVESCAQVIVALTSLAIDPHNDERFIKNGNSVVEALLSFAVENGGFYHVKPGEKGNGGAEPGQVDLMATDQAFYALVAYYRFVNGQNSLYNMTDVK